MLTQKDLLLIAKKISKELNNTIIEIKIGNLMLAINGNGKFEYVNFIDENEATACDKKYKEALENKIPKLIEAIEQKRLEVANKYNKI